MKSNEIYNWAVCLCDHDPIPLATEAPLDIRNVRRTDLETLSHNYKFDRLRIYNYRDSDLASLTEMTDLTTLQIEWASKVVSIAFLGKLHRLRSLKLRDLSAVRDVTALSVLTELESLEISGGIWKPMRINTIKWITQLSRLKSVSLYNLKIDDDDVTALAELPNIERVNLANMWPMEQFAFLSAKIGTAMKAPLPVMELKGVICERCESTKVVLIGRRKPTLCPACQGQMLEKERQRYDKAVERAKLLHV